MSDLVNCQRCASTRLLFVQAHARDMFNLSIGEPARCDHQGYLPRDLGIGAGDDLTMDLCLDCGQVQGTYPLPLSKVETT